MKTPNCKRCGCEREQSDESGWGPKGYKPYQKMCWNCWNELNPPKEKIEPGVLYIAQYFNDFLDEPIEGMYKIGITRRNGNARMEELGDTNGPMKVIMVESWKVKDPEVVEDELHTMFEKHGICGEWFNISKEVILKECEDYIQAISR